MAAGLLPLALYAFGVRTRRKRAEATAEEALRPRSYGQVAGRSSRGYQEGMTGFMPPVCQNRQSDSECPQANEGRKNAPRPFSMPRSDDPTRPDLSDFRTRAQWVYDFSTVGSPGYIANDEERNAALASLFGTLNPTTGVPNMLPALTLMQPRQKTRASKYGRLWAATLVRLS